MACSLKGDTVWDVGVWEDYWEFNDVTVIPATRSGVGSAQGYFYDDIIRFRVCGHL